MAFQGELGAFSELATYEYFCNEVKVIPKETFADIFDAVSAGEADHGIIPIENSLTGSIHENYDLLLEHELVITGEIKLRIVHNLIVNKGVKLSNIKQLVLMRLRDSTILTILYWLVKPNVLHTRKLIVTAIHRTMLRNIPICLKINLL